MISTTQLDKKAGFKAEWETTFSPYLNSASAETELVSACGEWLQKDDDSEGDYFVGLLFWKSDSQATSPQLLREANVHNVADHIERLVGDATEVVSANTSQLKHVFSDFFELRPDDPSPNSVQSQTQHQLFKTPVKPRYSPDESVDSLGRDKVHLESMIQAIHELRIAAAPAGVWYPMGVISQHNLPLQPASNSKANMEMISFFSQIGNEQVLTSFANLRKRLWELCDCPQLAWGKNQSNEEKNDNIVLFIRMFTFCP